MDLFKTCDAECVRFQELFFDLDRAVRRLSTCGWGVVNNKKSQYEKLIESAKNYSMALQVLRNFTGSIMMGYTIFDTDFPKKIKKLKADELVKTQHLLLSVDDETKLSVIGFVKNYSTAKDKLKLDHAAFFEGEPHLLKFFVVN